MSQGMQEPWIQNLENVYHRAQHVLSWAFIGVGFAGSIGNILTLRVFTKMGCSNTFQISCSALAVSDLCCVIAFLICGITNLLGSNFGDDTFFYVGNFVGITFSRTTALITAWVSLERCLCVAFPTKVKLIITHTLTRVVLLAIFFIGGFILFIALMVFGIKFNDDSQSNKTSVIFREYEQPRLNGFQQLLMLLVGLFIPVFSWVSVTICTTFLIVKLKKTVNWRRVNAQAAPVWSTETRGVETSQNQSRSVKEKRAVKVVIAVAGIFLICTAPNSAHLLASFVFRDYFIDGSLRYLFAINSMLCMLLTQLNSSINMIVFAVLGYNFRSTLLQVLSGGFSTLCCGRFSTH